MGNSLLTSEISNDSAAHRCALPCSSGVSNQAQSVSVAAPVQLLLGFILHVTVHFHRSAAHGSEDRLRGRESRITACCIRNAGAYGTCSHVCVNPSTPEATPTSEQGKEDRLHHRRRFTARQNELYGCCRNRRHRSTPSNRPRYSRGCRTRSSCR